MPGGIFTNSATCLSRPAEFSQIPLHRSAATFLRNLPDRKFSISGKLLAIVKGLRIGSFGSEIRQVVPPASTRLKRLPRQGRFRTSGLDAAHMQRNGPSPRRFRILDPGRYANCSATHAGVFRRPDGPPRPGSHLSGGTYQYLHAFVPPTTGARRLFEPSKTVRDSVVNIHGQKMLNPAKIPRSTATAPGASTAWAPAS